MYETPRFHQAFLDELSKFIEAAEKDALSKTMKEILCPCLDCKNMKAWVKKEVVRSHLVRRGFVVGYTVWSKHGETIEAEHKVVQELPSCLTGGIHDNDDDHKMMDDSGVELEDMLRHAEPEVIMGSAKGLDNFEELQKAAKQLLYDESKGCDKDFSVLRSVLQLLTLKASNGWSDSSFNDLLVLLKKMLPNPNSLPTSTYQAKKLICPLSLGVQKIHACVNHCILYRKENEKLDSCPTCGASRYKSGADPLSNKRDSSSDPKRKIPELVVWYLPIKDRLKRLFSNPRDAELVRWHKEKRKHDGKLRHPANAL